MGSLKKCPECHGDFHRLPNGIQVCKTCGYWTRENTARMESLMLYEEAMLSEGGLRMENQPEKSCKNCKNMLKRQKLGMNIVYYCSNCGCMTSADLL